MELTNDQLLDLFNGRDVTLSDGRVATFKAAKSRPTDSWGEYEYGNEDIWLVFQVGDTYYKQYGYQPSWGDAVFDGVVKEVAPVFKTIEVWE